MNRYQKRNDQTASRVFTGSGKSGKDSVRLLPMGGVGGVTKNMYVYEYRYDGKLQDILIIDCGIGFPDQEMYGVDLLIPDVTYVEKYKDKIRGIVFTHGHDDHTGGIPYVYPRLGNIRMWGTKLTAAFANIKLAEVGIKARVSPVNFGTKLTIGPFGITCIRVTHSVPDTAHVIIETPVGIFYHGSDFKFDMDPLDGKVSDFSAMNAVGARGVLCMLTDCLGSERPGMTPSEQIIGQTLEKELSLCQGRFLFTTQSSNVSRIQLAIELGIKYGRKIALLGRSVDQNVEEAVKLGYMNIPRDRFVRDRDIRKVPAHKQFLVVAGAQAQPESALTRIAYDNHKFVHIGQGDTVVFSADPIPGYETGVHGLIDQLYKQGARVSYSDIMQDLHVSGHGSQGDLMLLLSAVRPSYVFPIGGTYRHIMQYQRLAGELGYPRSAVLIPEDGQVLEFRVNYPPKVVQTIPLDTIMVDGLGVGDVGTVVLRDRQTIAKEGIVVVVVPVNTSTGLVAAPPDIISRGFVYIKQSSDLLKRARHVVAQSMKLHKGKVINWQHMRKLVEENLSGFLYKETGRSPLIVPVILEV